MQSKIKKFDLCVRDSSISKFNLYWVIILLLLPLIFSFNVFFLLLFIVATAFVVAFQKEFSANVAKWNADIPEDAMLTIDLETNKICTSYWEIPLFNVREVTFTYDVQPEQTGISKFLLGLYFVNVSVDLNSENKIFKVPIQSKKEIKRLQKFFVRMNIKTTLDVKLYNI